MNPPTPWQSLLQELRGQDFDRYATCLFAPPEQRADLAALFLFNATLAQIRDQVTEPLLGNIRLQWWRDELARLNKGNKAPEQPVLEIIGSWRQRGLDLTPLLTMIDARATDLDNPPFPTLSDYIAYRRNTSRPLGVMAAKLIGQERHAELYADSMELYATIGLLRAVPHWVKRRQQPLPPEWLRHYIIDETNLMELRSSPGLTALTHSEAKQTLTACTRLQQQWSDLLKPERQAGLCLSLHLAFARLDATRLLQSAAPWRQAHPTRWLRLIHLAWHALRGE